MESSRFQGKEVVKPTTFAPKNVQANMDQMAQYFTVPLIVVPASKQEQRHQAPGMLCRMRLNSCRFVWMATLTTFALLLLSDLRIFACYRCRTSQILDCFFRRRRHAADDDDGNTLLDTLTTSDARLNC